MVLPLLNFSSEEEANAISKLNLVYDGADLKMKPGTVKLLFPLISNLDNHPSGISAPQKPGRKDISQNSHGASNLKGPIVFL